MKAYPIRDGRPVFLTDAAAVKVMPEGHASNPIPKIACDLLGALDGPALNIGAGSTEQKLPNCIEMEYAIFRHTDVVGDAHCLPFADGAFAAVITFNTFEHLYDPARAAQEIYRVLRPGGRVLLHTAFLQPLHEAPHHYYNATEFGIRQWFRAFQIDELSVSNNFQPAYALAWLASELHRCMTGELGSRAARRFEQTSIKFWKDAWQNPKLRLDSRWDLPVRLSAETQKQLAAGFQLQAIKRA
jgi:SAM-dependent methyltransferase